MNAYGYDPSFGEGYKKYWDFSMWDMALHDLPAAIKKVREVTGLDKIK